MRAFEFQDRSYLLESVSTEVTKLGTLLDKSVEQDKPEVTKEIGQTIKAMLDATNKMVAVIKDSKKAPKTTTTQPDTNKFKPITPPSQQDQRLAASQAYAQKPVESLDEEVSAQLSDAEVASLEKDIALMEENLKFIKEMMPKTDPKVVARIKEMETILGGMNKKHEAALDVARNEYKVLDPDLEVMLEKTGSNNPQDLAKARSIFLEDDIDIKDAQLFVQQAGGEGIIDMNKLVEKRKGTLKDKDILLGGPKVAKVLDIVLPTFLEWKPGKTAGNVGPGEFALVMLGNPVSKEGKGDIKVGDDMYEVKAGGAKQKELKSGALGKPERTGAFFDSGSGKEARPHVEKMLKDYGFTNFKRDGGSRGPQFAYDLLNTKTNNWNTEFDRLNMDVDKRAEVLAKMASIIYSPGVRATEEFPFEKVKEDIKKILEKTDGSISLGQEKPDKDSETFSNNSELIRYFGKLALTKYREEGKSKDNFLFFNKTTFKFRVFKGEEMENEVMKPDSDLKAIAGVALSYTDSQSRSSPRFHLK
jgi:hypothetical protein